MMMIKRLRKWVWN